MTKRIFYFDQTYVVISRIWYNANQMINTVFFDLGNTLLFNDHRTGILPACQSMASVIAAFGHAVDTADLAQTHFDNLTEYYKSREVRLEEMAASDFLQKTLSAFELENIPEEQIDAAIQAFYTHTEMNWHLTEFAIPTLNVLKDSGKTIGLITNASSDYDVRQLLRLNGLDVWFDTVTISAECGFRKPHKEIYSQALQSTGSLPNESVMVGDTFIADIYGSSRIGMHNIWFNRYTEDWTTQALFASLRADADTQDLREVPQIIEKINSNPDQSSSF